MPRIEIADFEFSDRIVAKFRRHGIGTEQVYAVLGNFRITIRNRKERAASHILLGTDDQGRCLAIPIVPTDDPYVWRPITAWYCKPSEVAILRRRRPK
jgi:hypothetical protein